MKNTEDNEYGVIENESERGEIDMIICDSNVSYNINSIIDINILTDIIFYE